MTAPFTDWPVGFTADGEPIWARGVEARWWPAAKPAAAQAGDEMRSATVTTVIPEPKCMRSRAYPHAVRSRPFHLFFAHQVPRFIVRWTACLIRHRESVTMLTALSTGRYRRCRWCNKLVSKPAP